MGAGVAGHFKPAALKTIFVDSCGLAYLRFWISGIHRHGVGDFVGKVYDSHGKDSLLPTVQATAFKPMFLVLRVSLSGK
jgi:hypothetical protein